MAKHVCLKLIAYCKGFVTLGAFVWLIICVATAKVNIFYK